MRPLTLITTLAAATLITSARAEKFEVRNTEGRALMIDLVSLEENTVTFTANGRTHSLPIDQFDADSREKIRTTAKSLLAKVPSITTDISVNTRRTKDENNRETESVVGKVKIRNNDTKTAFPETTASLIYFSSAPRLTDVFQILSVKAFTLSIPAGDTFEKELGGVSLTLGGGGGRGGRGGFGGFTTEYEGYLFVIANAENQILHTKTSSTALRSALQRDPSLASRLLLLHSRDLLDPKTFEKIELPAPQRPE